jgi:hypothetical protein
LIRLTSAVNHISARPECLPRHNSQLQSLLPVLRSAFCLLSLQAAAFSRLQQYDFSEAATPHHTGHSPDTPHAQPPHLLLHQHHDSSNTYGNMSSDPNQQHHSSSGIEDCPTSSAAAAAGGGYDMNLNSSQLAAAQQHMMSQAAAAGGDGSVGFVPGSASGMQHMSMSMAAGEGQLVTRVDHWAVMIQC